MLQVGVDRMMFSTDYPYQSMAPATAFLDSLPVSPQDRERVAHGNAETSCTSWDGGKCAAQ
jgi:uncharacterized protein